MCELTQVRISLGVYPGEQRVDVQDHIAAQALANERSQEIYGGPQPKSWLVLFLSPMASRQYLAIEQSQAQSQSWHET